MDTEKMQHDLGEARGFPKQGSLILHLQNILPDRVI